MHSITRAALGAALAVTLAIPAQPRAQTTGDDAMRVAVFPLVGRKVNRKVVRAIDAALQSAGVSFSEVDLVYGAKLRRKIRRNPKAAVARCERARRFPPCVRKLVRKARAQSALLGRVKRTPTGGVAVLLLAVSEDGSVSPRGKFVFESVTDMNEQWDDDAMREVYGLPVEDPNPSETDTPEAPPTVAAAPLPPPVPPPPEQQTTPLVANGDGVADTTTGEKPTLVSMRSANLLAPDMAALGSDDTPSIQRAFTPPGDDDKPAGSALMRWGGVSLAVAGVAAVGTGAFFSLTAQSTADGISNNGSLVQRDAVKQNKNANDQISQANLLFMVGGVATAVGAGLFGIDWLMRE